MSINKWIARRLTIGGTARVIAKQYTWCRQNKFKETAPDRLIFHEIIMLRFKFPDSRDLIHMVEEGKIRGLKDLVIEVLSIEAGYRKNTLENQLMFSEIIEEELLKKNIPLSAIK